MPALSPFIFSASMQIIREEAKLQVIEKQWRRSRNPSPALTMQTKQTSHPVWPPAPSKKSPVAPPNGWKLEEARRRGQRTLFKPVSYLDLFCPLHSAFVLCFVSVWASECSKPCRWRSRVPPRRDCSSLAIQGTWLICLNDQTIATPATLVISVICQPYSSRRPISTWSVDSIWPR